MQPMKISMTDGEHLLPATKCSSYYSCASIVCFLTSHGKDVGFFLTLVSLMVQPLIMINVHLYCYFSALFSLLRGQHKLSYVS
jgi:hypothetical protein